MKKIFYTIVYFELTNGQTECKSESYHTMYWAMRAYKVLKQLDMYTNVMMLKHTLGEYIETEVLEDGSPF